MSTSTQQAASSPVREAQRRIVNIAVWILLLEHRLYEIQQTLPLPAVHLAMEEESIPYGVASAIYGTLGQVGNQHLRHAARKLLEASKLTDQDLSLDFCDLGVESNGYRDLGPEVDEHE